MLINLNLVNHIFVYQLLSSLLNAVVVNANENLINHPGDDSTNIHYYPFRFYTTFVSPDESQLTDPYANHDDDGSYASAYAFDGSNGLNRQKRLNDDFTTLSSFSANKDSTSPTDANDVYTNDPNGDPIAETTFTNPSGQADANRFTGRNAGDLLYEQPSKKEIVELNSLNDNEPTYLAFANLEDTNEDVKEVIKYKERPVNVEYSTNLLDEDVVTEKIAGKFLYF